jgi:hypothetical protein
VNLGLGGIVGVDGEAVAGIDATLSEPLEPPGPRATVRGVPWNH